MAHLQKSSVTFRVSGDTLIPDEISHLLGCQPTQAHSKGEPISRQSESGQEVFSRVGIWRLKAPDCTPENLDYQVLWLMNNLTNDLEVWKSLKEKYRLDLFCGLFMGSHNEGLTLSPDTLILLGARGIEIGFDIYDLSL